MEKERLWIQKLPKKELLYTFLREGGFTPLISQLLINKGFTEVKAAYTFLFPQINDFSDPFEIPEMSLAVKRLAEALKAKEVIGIYGDSDADG
ncbi:MAG: single-stranded-DNA-specific exonuclease RecJ, partial [Caldimicrobium thiodismutans]